MWLPWAETQAAFLFYGMKVLCDEFLVPFPLDWVRSRLYEDKQFVKGGETRFNYPRKETGTCFSDMAVLVAVEERGGSIIKTYKLEVFMQG